MNDVKILLCGNSKKEEIISISENLKKQYNLNMLIKDCSSSTHNENIEYYFSLINDIQYFNIFVLNHDNKKDIFDFIELFKSEEWGITNDCYPFFLIPSYIVSKIEAYNYIDKLNKSRTDDYKFKVRLFLFYNEIEKSKNNDSFKDYILNIYNCYIQDNIGYDDSKETINILLIGCKNSGKSVLINNLLGEIRALSMEHHFTTKINFYKHKKYPIVFYDTSGFNHNEDEEVLNLDSKITEFNKNYKNIKHKIHAIFYLIECDNVRILQRREKEVIENIFQINIPLFIVGQKGKITNMKNFVRKTKFELSTFPDKYNNNIETLKNRIICLDSTKTSVVNLLKSVYQEFLLSTHFNEQIMNTSSILKDEDLINKSLSENININRSNEEERVIQEILGKINKSIFFNDLNEKLKEIKKKILKIREKYINDKLFILKPDLNKLNQEIENEFRDLFDTSDLNEIKTIIEQYQNGKDIEGNNNIINLKNIAVGTTIGAGIVVTSYLLLPILVPIGVGIPFVIADAYFLKKRYDTLKTNIDENFENSYKKFEEKYILLNIYLIRKKAEIYNNAINEFNKFIKEFESEGEVFI